ncbi:M12 family metallo-peptidase [Nocardioides sp.]|uniref:M12 family metallo-peptidase n=1 Tax=Nocardioides sp. TaxID=35761 RepID=UPI00378350A6
MGGPLGRRPSRDRPAGPDPSRSARVGAVADRFGHLVRRPAYVARGASTNLSYYAADLPPDAAERTFVERTPRDAEAVTGLPADPARAGAEVARRTYRLALLNDPSYAAYFPGAVLAAKTTLVNRVNQIYNDDLGVRLVLVAGTDELNLDTEAKATGTNGPCGAGACFSPGALSGCGSALDENQSAVDRILGNGNAANGKAAYDVGHVVLGNDGGGVAGLGVVGNDALKAVGCTGLPTPTGDLFYVDYVSHELGHQFGADHTFAGSNGFCAGNRNTPTAVEPGSGSSVMAYAGICGSDNLQPHSDPYFSHASIAEIQSYLATVPGVGTSSDSGNHAPTVSAPASRTLPKRTPFTLTATGSDTDGDELTYLWEQSDPAARNLADPDAGSGPLFRVFGTAAEVSAEGALESPSPGENTATGDPSRTFPDLAQVVSGDTNAATGGCSGGDVDCLSELLPTVSRSMHFVVTARDGFATGGGTARGTVTLPVDATTGPLLVTSQAGGETDTGGAVGTVTWAVNQTDTLASDVAILMSTDGGVTFPTTLVDSTPNDGEATVVWPAGDTTQARVMVRAVDNYFFAVNTAPFTISGSVPPPPDTSITSGPPSGGFALADAVTIGFGSTSGSASYECTLDGAGRPCAAPSVRLTGLAPGTHALSVAATDDAGTDPSPAVRRWSRPYGAAALARHGSWTSVRSPAAYLGRSWQTRTAGASLTRKVPATTRVALVVQTGPGFGTLRVDLGGKRIGTVSTASAVSRHRVLKVLPAFATRSGTLTVTTLRGRPVRVEGVGLLTAG